MNRTIIAIQITQHEKGYSAIVQRGDENGHCRERHSEDLASSPEYHLHQIAAWCAYQLSLCTGTAEATKVGA